MGNRNGWIKLHRSLIDHWVFADGWKLRAWLDLCFMANYAETKVPVGMSLINVKRGQILTSFLQLSKRWNCSISKARRLIFLFEKDGMCRVKSETLYTIVTICNYETYQDVTEFGEKQTKNKRKTNEHIIRRIKKNKEEDHILTDYEPPTNQIL